MTTEPSPPRLCHMRKRQDFKGFGFTLHAGRGQEGQVISGLDAGSPAEAAGLREGDKIIEVNGVNVLRENHSQVVSRIRGVDFETRFLVVDQGSWEIYQQRGIPINGDMPNVLKMFSEPEETYEYLARLVHLRTWSDFEGYGFNLHYHKDQGKHVVGKVDEDSPARCTGIVEEDVIVEVNGVNVEHSSHKEVIEKITERLDNVDMLLVASLERQYFREKGVNVGGWMAQLRHLHCPTSNPFTAGEAQQPQSTDVEAQRRAEDEAIKAVENSLESHRLRLAHLRIWGDGNGYGFNMQSEKKKVGKFISNVEIDSPADYGGLKEGDMILAVNGTSVEGFKHQDVVSLIRSNPTETSLLLVDPASKDHFDTAGLPLYEQEKMAEYIDSVDVPESRPTDTKTPLNRLGKEAENKENLKNEKPEIILDVNAIQPSGIYSTQKPTESVSIAGTGGVTLNTNHVPSPTAVVGGIEFAGSAQEARQRLAKKKQASQQMSLQARYELYKKL